MPASADVLNEREAFDPEPMAGVREERWSPSMTAAFVVATSATLWAGIALAARWALA